MRGKARLQTALMVQMRITPAHAGKSRIRSGLRFWKRDHPRACGEKKQDLLKYSYGEGSPPRMRGKAWGTAVNALSVRITPAYAGKRRCWAGCKLLVWDHPRVCGEKPCSFPRWRTSPGSPPRVRGKVNIARFYITRHRITPAYAGKRIIAERAAIFSRDHPRVCGEKVTSTLSRIPK